MAESQILHPAQLTRRLGASGITVPALGVGVWAWGDRRFWGYGKRYTVEDVKQAYRVSIDAGLALFDTAEIYGGGRSERLLGRCIRWDGRPAIVASKYAPLPYRLRPRALARALDATLARLDRRYVDLYQIHWPYTPVSIDALMDGLAAAVQSGKARAVGVSNFSARQMERAHRRLASHGIPLASNQVHYSLLRRDPEIDGVLDACRGLGVALIAYSPLEQGVLSGKYTGAQRITPPLARRFTSAFRHAQDEPVRAVIDALRAIAIARDATVSQIALNWLLCRDELVIPIPGAKDARQAAQNAGAIGWRLEPEEMAHLDEVSRFARR